MSASAELRRLLDQATPGPWFIVGPPWNEAAPWINGGQEDPHGGSMVCDFINLREDAGELPEAEQNADLIVYLVNHAPVLADLIDAAEWMDAEAMPEFGKPGFAARNRIRAVLARLTTGETIGG